MTRIAINGWCAHLQPNEHSLQTIRLKSARHTVLFSSNLSYNHMYLMHSIKIILIAFYVATENELETCFFSEAHRVRITSKAKYKMALELICSTLLLFEYLHFTKNQALCS